MGGGQRAVLLLPLPPPPPPSLPLSQSTSRSIRCSWAMAIRSATRYGSSQGSAGLRRCSSF